MHICDPRLGIFGANGIVGAGLPIAVGAAFAAQMRHDDSVVVAFFGDGAVAQGAFHEAVNLAALWHLPLVFLCENNHYAEFSAAAWFGVGTGQQAMLPLDNAQLSDKAFLTEGRFGVTDVISLGARSEQEVLRLAAGLESQSEHPIAAGVVRSAGERGIAVAPPKDFRAIPGKGAEALVEGVKVKVVSPGYLKASGLSADHPRVREVAEQGKTVVYVLVDERTEGAIALADVIRPESREALARLKALGIRVMMLTGDASAVARWVARELDLDEFFAEVLPDQKAARIKDVQARGLTVAMTGDGVNDAPALTQADVGIAVGAGTDVAIESADIVLVRSDPRDVATIVELARATYRKMVQNLWWATGYNVLAIPVAAGVLYPAGILLTPAVGAVLMSVSTVLVAFNARLLRLRR